MDLRFFLLLFAFWLCIGAVVSIVVHEFNIFDDNQEVK